MMFLSDEENLGHNCHSAELSLGRAGNRQNCQFKRLAAANDLNLIADSAVAVFPLRRGLSHLLLVLEKLRMRRRSLA